MKIENTVCTLEQAREIHKSGVENLSTLFVFGMGPDNIWKLQLNIEYCGESEYCSFIPAYTVAELGILLPWRGNNYEFIVGQESNGFVHRLKIWSPGSNHVDLYYIEKISEAEARADALIWLINNEYIINTNELKL